MMPYLEDSPVTLHYFPQGLSGVSFYKRDFKSVLPGLVESYPYHEMSQDKIIQVPVVKSRAGIIYLVSKACLEFHTWASKITDFNILTVPQRIKEKGDLFKDLLVSQQELPGIK